MSLCSLFKSHWDPCLVLLLLRSAVFEHFAHLTIVLHFAKTFGKHFAAGYNAVRSATGFVSPAA